MKLTFILNIPSKYTVQQFYFSQKSRTNYNNVKILSKNHDFEFWNKTTKVKKVLDISTNSLIKFQEI